MCQMRILLSFLDSFSLFNVKQFSIKAFLEVSLVPLTLRSALLFKFFEESKPFLVYWFAA